MSIEKSLALQARAAKIIPGMNQLRSKRPDMFSRGVWPAYGAEAQGSHVCDLDGNEYIDFSLGGIGATVLGCADPDVDNVIHNVIATGSASSFNPPEEVYLAEKLVSLHPWAEMVRFARSGGEAMAMAVRIIRAATGKSKVVFCGYHGWMDWYIAANLGGTDALGGHLIGGLSTAGVPKERKGTSLPFRFNDIESFRKAIAEAGDDLAGVVMEPKRNFDPEPEFMEEVHSTVKRLGVPLVIDEISAGFRISIGGSHKVFGWQPDVAVFAKALGNGYPISAVIGKGKFMQAAQESFISSTNWTERIGPAAGLAVIDKYERCNVHEHLCAIGDRIQSGWIRLEEKHHLGIHISGLLPMLHFTFGEDPLVNRAFFTQEMLKRGFMAGMTAYAMYAHTFDEVDAYIEAVDEVWGEIARGGVADRLEGKPAVSGFARIN